MKKIVKRSDCPFCDNGVDADETPCDYCGGIGEYGKEHLSYECVICETTGKVEGEDCKVCLGLGYIPIDFTVILDMANKINDIFEKVNE